MSLVPSPSPRSAVLAAILASALVGALAGCRAPEAERRERQAEAEKATAAAEEMASEATITGASLDTRDETQASPEDSERAREEIIAAFRLEQSDYRARLQKTLDALDRDVARARGAARSETPLRQLRERRSLLKADLVSLDRATEQDWATLRTKLDRDLRGSRP